MLTVSMIECILQRAGVTDFDFGSATTDLFGDIVTVFDPDMDFQTVSKAIENYRPLRVKIADNGTNYVEIHDIEYVDGMPVSVAYLFNQGESGYGTSAKAMVKSLQALVNGEVKSFLGFADLRNYRERFVAE